jgi:hypothetical protein
LIDISSVADKPYEQEVFVLIRLVAHRLIIGSMQLLEKKSRPTRLLASLSWSFLSVLKFGGGRALPLALHSWMYTWLEGWRQSYIVNEAKALVLQPAVRHCAWFYAAMSCGVAPFLGTACHSLNGTSKEAWSFILKQKKGDIKDK